jgi:hypothetical protein
MKRLVTTDKVIYDRTGKWLGREVIEVDGFTEQELHNQPACPECGAYNGGHREYFVKTGQHGGGEVYGHYQQCETGKG